jgi:hypothetical protein
MQRSNHVARSQQHTRDNQLLHCVGIGTRSVENWHASHIHFFNWYIISTSARAGNGFHTSRDIHLQHIVRAHQDRIGFCNVAANNIICSWQAV